VRTLVNVAFGLSYRYSPVLGIGMQWGDRDAGLRLDIQSFSCGRDLYGRGRLIGSFFIVI
jgi:hypothetical protein